MEDELNVPDTNVGDMISRQVAMEMLMAQNVIMGGSEYHNGFNAGVNRSQEVIRNLPPVQPETATITIGRTRGETTMWYECDACGELVDLNDNYCRNCGRKLIHD